MLQPTERMHSRNKMIQIGAACMGQQLIACYRTLKSEETGEAFCMMMRWSAPGDSPVRFNVQKDDELIHLWYEDNGCNFDREKYLEQNGDLQLAESITSSEVYQRVYKQLLNGISKGIAQEGYCVQDDLTVACK